MGYRIEPINRLALTADDLNLIIKALGYLDMDVSSHVNFEKRDQRDDHETRHVWYVDFITRMGTDKITEFLGFISTSAFKELYVDHYQTEGDFDPVFGIAGWSVIGSNNYCTKATTE